MVAKKKKASEDKPKTTADVKEELATASKDEPRETIKVAGETRPLSGRTQETAKRLAPQRTMTTADGKRVKVTPEDELVGDELYQQRAKDTGNPVEIERDQSEFARSQ